MPFTNISKLYIGNSRVCLEVSRVVSREFEYSRKEIGGLPRGETIKSRTYYPRLEKNQSRDNNLRELYRGSNTEEFSSRFIIFPRGLKKPRNRKRPRKLPTLVEYDVHDAFYLFSIVFISNNKRMIKVNVIRVKKKT